MIARVTGASYTDTAVSEGATYYYVVRALDQSFNRSGNSARSADSSTAHSDFDLQRDCPRHHRCHRPLGLHRRLPGPSGWRVAAVEPRRRVVLTRVDATHWTITFTGKESTRSNTNTHSAIGIMWKRILPAVKLETAS